MFDQLLGPSNPGTHLGRFEMDEIQVVALLTPCKEIVVHLGKRPGHPVGLHEMVLKRLRTPVCFAEDRPS